MSMKRCAFLTLADPTGFVIDDQEAYPSFAELGWSVEAVPWTGTPAWRSFDAVVVRSTWDYQNHLLRFHDVLAQIVRDDVPLFNSLALITWNSSKTYLRDLARHGVAITPTLWREELHLGEVTQFFGELGTGEIVVKPQIGANSDGVFRLRQEGWQAMADAVSSYYAGRSLFVQPFLGSILREGEYSLFYFNGRFSHAVLKSPEPGNFLVQEEHGGRIQPVQPTDVLLSAGDKVLSVLSEVPLYARVDLVRANTDDGFWVMELELIEPSLYLRMDPNAPRRFAEAFHQRMQQG
jgi:glutathione synthase/RimK-type ligase-like ATP-grasp enzyme